MPAQMQGGAASWQRPRVTYRHPAPQATPLPPAVYSSPATKRIEIELTQ